jgi:GntR family transcriptional regulator, transcriptional repressor for pyruvate dehydrogenase complex
MNEHQGDGVRFGDSDALNGIDVEILILSAIRESIEPVGAVSLSLELQQELEISQATVGRKLKEFDVRGLTQRVGFKGRALTQKGEEYLEQKMNSSIMLRQGQAFFAALGEDDEDRLIQVLEARRALERETARLAAERISDEECIGLQRTLDEQRNALRRGESGSYQNLAFHEAITTAARNEILAHALYLVRNQSRLTLLLGTIRRAVDGIMMQDHQAILDAISARDPAKAEAAMATHIDRIISDVRRYFVERPEGVAHEEIDVDN